MNHDEPLTFSALIEFEADFVDLFQIILITHMSNIFVNEFKHINFTCKQCFSLFRQNWAMNKSCYWKNIFMNWILFEKWKKWKRFVSNWNVLFLSLTFFWERKNDWRIKIRWQHQTIEYAFVYADHFAISQWKITRMKYELFRFDEIILFGIQYHVSELQNNKQFHVILMNSRSFASFLFVLIFSLPCAYA